MARREGEQMKPHEKIEITRDRVAEMEQSAEWHPVPFQWMRVSAFHEGAIIREAAAQYWAPDPGGNSLWDIAEGVIPQGFLESYGREDEHDYMVRVRIVLSYPLNDVHAIEVELQPSRLGEIFSIAHDLYDWIYKLDDKAWKNSGHDDAPQIHPKILNRARGKYVWGHDMGDLVFEGVMFVPNPEWPKVWKKKSVVIPVFDENGIADPKSIEQKETTETRYEALRKEKHGDTKPLIGTFMFAIGS
jgi:hypothetical protein